MITTMFIKNSISKIWANSIYGMHDTLTKAMVFNNFKSTLFHNLHSVNSIDSYMGKKYLCRVESLKHDLEYLCHTTHDKFLSDIMSVPSYTIGETELLDLTHNGFNKCIYQWNRKYIDTVEMSLMSDSLMSDYELKFIKEEMERNTEIPYPYYEDS